MKNPFIKAVDENDLETHLEELIERLKGIRPLNLKDAEKLVVGYDDGRFLDADGHLGPLEDAMIWDRRELNGLLPEVIDEDGMLSNVHRMDIVGSILFMQLYQAVEFYRRTY